MLPPTAGPLHLLFPMPGMLFHMACSINHSPSPLSQSLATTNIYFTSQCIHLLWAFHINRVIQHLVSYVWLLSFSMMFSRLIHMIACISPSFLMTDKLYSITWIDHILFIHSSVGDHLSCFRYYEWRCYEHVFFLISFIVLEMLLVNKNCVPKKSLYLNFLAAHVLPKMHTTSTARALSYVIKAQNCTLPWKSEKMSEMSLQSRDFSLCHTSLLINRRHGRA